MPRNWLPPLITTMIVLLAACQPKTWVPTGPTPDVPYYGEYTLFSNRPFPKFLDCSLIPPEVSLGPSWNGLQIGKTNFEEMVQLLEADDVSWLHTKLLFESPREDGAHDYYTACFSGDTLSALQVGTTEETRSFEDYFVLNYGYPDYVTWGSYNTERAAIWPEEGILVILKDPWEPRPTIVLLFSPIPLREFGESRLWQALPDENDDTITDVAPLPSEEDPWGIAKYDTNELP